MRKILFMSLAWLTFVGTACVRTAVNEATGEVDLDIESPTQRGEDWGGRIRGQGQWSGITGESRALVAEGRTQLSVTIQGAPPGANLTWVVREGRCGERGEIVGMASWYSTLSVGSDGRAGATQNLAARLDEAKDYVVELYSSQMDPVTNRPQVVACGDLDD